MAGGNPIRPLKQRFNHRMTQLLLQLKWWDFEPEKLVDILPLLCNLDLEAVRKEFKKLIDHTQEEKNHPST